MNLQVKENTGLNYSQLSSQAWNEESKRDKLSSCLIIRNIMSMNIKHPK